MAELMNRIVEQALVELEQEALAELGGELKPRAAVSQGEHP
jgi:hypothetical protein